MTKPSAVVRKLSTLIPDTKNANKGTVRGRAMLEDSLQQDGAGRGILLDKNGNVIAGNKTLETAFENGFDEVIVVPTDGKQLVATQRIDVDIDSEQGRRMAIRDNRVAQVDLEWDASALQGLLDDGVDLSGLFDADELDATLIDARVQGGDWSAAMGDLPSGDKSPFQQMTFTLADSQAQTVDDALSKAKAAGAFVATGNENSNGNALWRICDAYLHS